MSVSVIKTKSLVSNPASNGAIKSAGAFLTASLKFSAEKRSIPSSRSNPFKRSPAPKEAAVIITFFELF